jgi:methionyl-tRNA synthetase
MNTFYVATAIPYVNDKPHIGHGLDYTLADVLARYHKQQGKDVFFEVGTDEHGSKIANKAAEAGMQPKAYVDSIVPLWQGFWNKLNIEPTAQIRTTSPEHEKTAQFIWTQLKDYIYKGTYEGWYCVGCECFVTDQQATANNGVCPDHQKPYEKLSEDNYFFKLSAFGQQIHDALIAGELKIVPEFRQNEILQLIKSGLEDISVSRPKNHLAWGIPVPGDDDQVMYVWFEALMNYLTILGYPNGEDFKKFWPPNVHVIGKDIIRFHAAIWPAMLIALDLPLPRALLVHGHVLAGGTKMSKTIGNVIDPIEVINQYGVDAFRYYFLRHIPTIDDGDFTWEKFENAYNNELGNELGNLVQRVTSMINRYQEGVIGDLPQPRHDSSPVQREVDDFRFDRALEHIWVMIRNLNVYLEEVKPWEIAKNNDPEHLQEVLTYAAGGLQQIADLLRPFLPTTAETITTIFKGGVVRPYKGVLFPKIYNHTPDPRTAAPKPVAPPADNAAH